MRGCDCDTSSLAVTTSTTAAGTSGGGGPSVTHCYYATCCHLMLMSVASMTNTTCMTSSAGVAQTWSRGCRGAGSLHTVTRGQF